MEIDVNVLQTLPEEQEEQLRYCLGTCVDTVIPTTGDNTTVYTGS
ncbi:ALQxL family class IV lanthipeptide [Micromonospora auratinigra]|uniref:Uncharacterized protein n=1 Tax=Micromonospora auratinigra TaxID=261654 RepID=A0A1A8Z4P5_9ACTN|nr:ALQxL family class IV lanthipeptide [Micromonospora auratinigra]SBT38827.1 hypothetical protein GA0070611_0688 [Micromonospora auratinigra]